MLKNLQRYFLLSAWAILFAHSIVPHAHEAKAELQVCASEHRHTSDLLELLGHIFHFSTGEEHLEDFSAGSAQIVLFVGEAFQLAPLVLVVQQPSFLSPKTYFSKAHHRYRPLRAPPVYS